MLRLPARWHHVRHHFLSYWPDTQFNQDVYQDVYHLLQEW